MEALVGVSEKKGEIAASLANHYFQVSVYFIRELVNPISASVPAISLLRTLLTSSTKKWAKKK